MADQSHPLAKPINAGKARINFGQMLDEVYYKNDIFIIERAGRPMAAVIPLSLLEELQRNSGPAKMAYGTSKEKNRQSKKKRA